MWEVSALKVASRAMTYRYSLSVLEIRQIPQWTQFALENGGNNGKDHNGLPEPFCH